MMHEERLMTAAEKGRHQQRRKKKQRVEPKCFHILLCDLDLLQQNKTVSWLNVVKLSVWVKSLFGKRQIIKFTRCTVVFFFLVRIVGVKIPPFWHFESQFWLRKTDFVAKSFTSTQLKLWWLSDYHILRVQSVVARQDGLWKAAYHADLSPSL